MSEHEYRGGRDGEREPWQGEPSGEVAAVRRPWRLPTGMPRPATSRESRVLGRVVSIAVHVLIVIALLLPALLSPKVRAALATGAGGAGPAGGGGGSGGMGPRERVRYIRVAPMTEAPQPTPTQLPVPVPPKPQVVQPTPAQVQPQATPPPQQDAPANGMAAGSGDASGTGGAGPGSGGGIGAGIGTGMGNANGPGTGGGLGDTLNLPYSMSMLIPPQPVPKELKRRTIGVDFEIDSTGEVLSVNFEPTSNGGYNKLIRERAKQFRFRPATRRADGRPVRAIFHIDWILF